MKIKSWIFLVLIFVGNTGTLMAAEYEYKIGFVDTSRVLKEAPQARILEEGLKAEFQPGEAQIKSKRQEILNIENQLKSTEVQISVKLRRKLEREIRLKVSQLKFLEQEFREDKNLRRNESIRELQQIIANVLTTLGDSGSFDLILTEGVSYVSNKIDITTQVIDRLKQLSEQADAAQ